MSGSRKYPERLEIQTRAVTRTTSGRPEETWTAQYFRHAAVVSAGSSEGVQNNQHQNAQNYTITLPTDTATAALDPQTTRVIWHSAMGQITLNITGKSISPGRRPELVWTAITDK